MNAPFGRARPSQSFGALQPSQNLVAVPTSQVRLLVCLRLVVGAVNLLRHLDKNLK